MKRSIVILCGVLLIAIFAIFSCEKEKKEVQKVKTTSNVSNSKNLKMKIISEIQKNKKITPSNYRKEIYPFILEYSRSAHSENLDKWNLVLKIADKAHTSKDAPQFDANYNNLRKELLKLWPSREKQIINDIDKLVSGYIERRSFSEKVLPLTEELSKYNNKYQILLKVSQKASKEGNKEIYEKIIDNFKEEINRFSNIN